MAGCFGTVTPKPVASNQASFDPSGQNSGFQYWTNKPQAHCSVWSAPAIARYNALCAKWGSDPRFVIPVQPWAGVVMELDGKTATNFVLDPEHLVDFIEMSSMQRAK